VIAHRQGEEPCCRGARPTKERIQLASGKINQSESRCDRRREGQLWGLWGLRQRPSLGLTKTDEEWSGTREVAQLSVADTSPEKEQCKSEQQRPRAQ
jgi:hypothetical protein